MRYSGNIGNYQLGQTIGEGTFAKVKLAKNGVHGQQVAVKIIDKSMVQREIKTMKLLNHPNIVRIYEVLGTKTKIYIVMEYVSGGQLSDKLSYTEKLNEKEARKLFQQLIDAVEYCHSRGVYHRDLKPQNLLLDSKGNLKISDFGLSALNQSQPESLLSTACGSPCYVAPELIRNRGYEGGAADTWACGVILYEMLSGRLPFNDQNYTCPEWFSISQKRLLSKIFDIDAKKRITIPDIMEDEWFQVDYVPAIGKDFVEDTDSNDDTASPISIEETTTDKSESQSPGFINAFQLIAMSQDLSLSGLFEEKDGDKKRVMMGSKHTITQTLEKIEAAAKGSCLLVERINNSKIKMHPPQKMKSSRSSVNLLAEVIEVSPTDCVVQVSKSVGELQTYQEFCKSLTNLLEETRKPLARQMSKDDSVIGTLIQAESSSSSTESTNLRGYSSS
ncbi:hypothetical protein V2J09_018843 [Rumex salicifolius]